MNSKSEKNIKPQEFNIYQELNSIKSPQISKHGRDFERYLKNRCIKGFLQRHALQKEMNKKIKNYEFDSIMSNSKDSVNDELIKLFPENQDWSGASIINSRKNQEFLDLMNQYLGKKTNEDNRDPKSVKNINRLKSPSSHRKYEISSDLLQYLHEIKNKVPSFCLYNPNYNAICPHVPFTKLQPIKLKGDSMRKERKSSSVTTKSNVVTNNLNNDNIIVEKNKIQSQIKLLSRKHSSHVLSFEKYSSRNDIFTKVIYKDSLLEPLKLPRKISSPIFKNMSPRYRKKVQTKIPVLVDYNLNYDIVYKNYRRKRKMEEKANCFIKPMRQIWSSFHATSDYLSVPYF